MIKTIFTMLKIAAIIALAVWLVDHPGTISLEWMEYKITTHLGLALVALLGVILVAIVLYRIYRTIIDAPQKLAERHARRREAKGHKALTLGMTAVAAGDATVAAYQSFRAQKFLGRGSSESKGMVLLLDAQAHRLNGDEAAANKSFAALLETPETAFLGVRGLLQAAIDHAQYDKARDYAEEGLRLHPKQIWILRIVYDLDLRDKNFSAAMALLKRLEKAGGFSKAEAKTERAAIETAQGLDHAAEQNFDSAAQHYRLALKHDGAFVPAALFIADIYTQQDKLGKLRSHLEKSIKANPHPELIARWAEMGQQMGKNLGALDPLAQMQWMERLKKMVSDDVHLHIALARAALDASLWGEARSYLEQARGSADIATAQIFKLFAALEEKTTGDELVIAAWHEEAASAPDDSVWYCAKSGMTLPEWQAFSPFSGAFNGIVWGQPSARFVSNTAKIPAPQTVLQPPKE